MYEKISSPSRPASHAFTIRSTSSRRISLWISASCFFDFASRELEPVRHDRQVLHPPALEALVVGFWVLEGDEVADGEGDDVLVGLPVGVARSLERPLQRVHDVPRDGRLLGDDER